MSDTVDEEIILTGDVVKINYAGKDFKNVTIDIMGPISKEIIRIKCPYFCPMMEGDTIIALGRYQKETDTYLLAKHPKVIIGTHIAVLEKLLAKCFWKKQKKQHEICSSILTLLGKVCRSENKIDPIGQLIDQFLSEMSEKYVYSLSHEEQKKIFMIFDSILTVYEVKLLMFFWFEKRLLRKLYLLGISLSDIREAEVPVSKLYEELNSKPLDVITVPLEKASNICEINEIVFSSEDVEKGKYGRYVYGTCKTNGWSYIPKKLKEIEFPLATQRHVVEKDDLVTLDTISQDEAEISTFISKKLKDVPRKRTWPSMFYSSLTPDQVGAVNMSINSSFSMILGPGGSGKTTILKTIINMLGSNEMIGIYSFTGKAVSRVKEVLDVIENNVTIMTMHQYIHRPSVIRPKYIFIDEVSMISLKLFAKFLRCLRAGDKDDFQITLIGDNWQLEPIEWAPLLDSLIKIEEIPKKILVNVHRTAVNTDNGVYMNCTAIRNGSLTVKEYDNFIMKEGNKYILQNTIKDLIKNGVLISDLVILCPYNKWLPDLNNIMRSFLHQRRIEDLATWAVGDRVTLTKNNYDIEVMNGDEGFVTKVDDDNVYVLFKGKAKENKFPLKEQTYHEELRDLLSYESFGELHCKYLVHSFALSIHKSQGSEWPFVLLFIPENMSTNFLTKRLVYTAISRAKQGLIMIGDVNTFKRGLRNESEHGKYLSLTLN